MCFDRDDVGLLSAGEISLLIDGYELAIGGEVTIGAG